MDKLIDIYGREKIENVVKKSKSFTDVLIKLELPKSKRRNIERTIRRLGISVDHFETIQNLKATNERYSFENLSEAVKLSYNLKQVIEKLDLLPITRNYITLKKKLKETGVDCSHFRRYGADYSKDNLEIVFKDSKSFADIFKKLGLESVGTGNYKTLKYYINKYNLDTSNFEHAKLSKNILYKTSINDILVENSTVGSSKVKERLYKEGLKERKCELCGQDETWQGKYMSLILDHINGVYNDNKIENLRIVCPNCNATLPTHCRGKRVKKDKHVPVDIKKANRVAYSITRRKVERPSYGQLKVEIDQLGYVQTGKKYGVSDNAIRKWVKAYEK